MNLTSKESDENFERKKQNLLKKIESFYTKEELINFLEDRFLKKYNFQTYKFGDKIVKQTIINTNSSKTVIEEAIKTGCYELIEHCLQNGYIKIDKLIDPSSIKTTIRLEMNVQKK